MNTSQSLAMQALESAKSYLWIYESNITTELECPVCVSVKFGPIYQCSQGHIICSECQNRDIRECPQCKERFKKPLARNRLAEAIIEKIGIELECTNSERGCLYKGQKAPLEEHEQECVFRKQKPKAKACVKNHVNAKKLGMKGRKEAKRMVGNGRPNKRR